MAWHAKILFLAIGALGAVSFASQSIRIPTKFTDSALKNPVVSATHFTEKQIRNRDYVEIKNREWSACHKRNGVSNYALSRDPVASFLEGAVRFKNLKEMEANGLTSGKVQVQPWSGDYWAYAAGILGARFRDDEFVYLYDWNKRYELVTANPASKILSTQGQKGVNSLSPSEKYDLLVGDSAGRLTAAMWSQGKQYYDEYGEVESWMGICHGWAPAAIVEPRPEKSIQVLSFDGKWQVPLNPSEIKGLVSYSWATNRFRNITMGNRCNQKDPQRNENGRIKEEACFDLNPATWHLVMTHMVGMNKRSFVMDATYDYEVWNQPVMAYSYTYFNPQTKQAQQNLESAVVSRETFTKDPFNKFRPAEARSFVGVSMKVGYVVETEANEMETDSPQDDAIRWVKYDYDLELDSNGQIIGGEWYMDTHPDFIWNPKKDARPLSSQDQNLSPASWVGPSLPEDWVKAAQKGSSYGEIINTITEALLKRSASR